MHVDGRRYQCQGEEVEVMGFVSKPGLEEESTENL